MPFAKEFYVIFQLPCMLSQAHPITSTGQFRLNSVRQQSVNMGNLEGLHKNCWFSVCSERWTLSVANVICTQLGWDGAIEFQQSIIGGGVSSQRRLSLGNTTCSGNEETTLECNRSSNWDIWDCKSSTFLLLTCRGECG